MVWSTLQLRPRDIRFTQDSIKSTFTRPGRHNGKLIGETLDELCEKKCTVREIEPIRVFLDNGRWWSADNRRLWVFKQYERLGGCDSILVRGININEVDKRKFRTKNNGKDVKVRGYQPGGLWHKQPDQALLLECREIEREIPSTEYLNQGTLNAYSHGYNNSINYAGHVPGNSGNVRSPSIGIQKPRNNITGQRGRPSISQSLYGHPASVDQSAQQSYRGQPVSTIFGNQNRPQIGSQQSDRGQPVSTIFGNQNRPQIGSQQSDRGQPVSTIFGNQNRPQIGSQQSDRGQPVSTIFGNQNRPQIGSQQSDRGQPVSTIFGNQSRPQIGSQQSDRGQPVSTILGNQNKPQIGSSTMTTRNEARILNSVSQRVAHRIKTAAARSRRSQPESGNPSVSRSNISTIVDKNTPGISSDELCVPSPNGGPECTLSRWVGRLDLSV